MASVRFAIDHEKNSKSRICTLTINNIECVQFKNATTEQTFVVGISSQKNTEEGIIHQKLTNLPEFRKPTYNYLIMFGDTKKNSMKR